MAGTITLRAYLDQLNTLLREESFNEVISHCRYILKHYPQNVETYRLLGQALLQRAAQGGDLAFFDEAAEIFRRVLSVSPTDHIAHLCLSEIRENQGDLDQAIWHLERAYEQMPGNAALQDALRELYVKRDGEGQAPEKIQLTRGALARQYAAGQLYDQALIELRAALDRMPERLDLQVLLAETLWESQHPVEAAEVAVQILKQLPNCLSANRIMAALWLTNERPTDAQVYLQRVEAVDPYEAERIVRPGQEVYDTHTLVRLDYTAQAAATLSSETPEWVQELGDLGEGAGMDAALGMPGEATSGPDRIDTDAVFGDQSAPPDWVEELGDASADEPVPDWLSGDAGEADAGAAMPADDFAPDWLSEQPVAEGVPGGQVAGPEAPGDDLPDWFDDIEEGASGAGDQPADEPDWLPSAGGEEDIPLPSFDDVTEPVGESKAEPGDAWLADDAGEEAVPEPSFDDLTGPVADDVPAEPDWLAETEAPPAESEPGDAWLADDMDEEAVPEPSFDDLTALVADDVPAEPEWLAETGASPAESEPGDAWLADDAGEEAVPEPSFDDLTAPVADDVPAEPEWLAETEAPPAESEPGDAWLADDAGEEAVPEPSFDDSAELVGVPGETSAEDQDALESDSPSGFTDLLASVEAQQSVAGLDEDDEDEDPTPPEWVVAFEDEGAEEHDSSPAPESPDEDGVVDDEAEFLAVLGEMPGEFQPDEVSDGAPEEQDADAVSDEELDALRRATMPPPGESDDFPHADEPEAASTGLDHSEADLPTPAAGEFTVPADDWDAAFAPADDSPPVFQEPLPDDEADQIEKAAAETDRWVAEFDEVADDAAAETDEWAAEFEDVAGDTEDVAEVSSEAIETGQPGQQLSPEPGADDEDWLSGLEEVDDTDLIEALDETDSSEEEMGADDAIEPATDLPEWIADAAPPAPAESESEAGSAPFTEHDDRAVAPEPVDVSAEASGPAWVDEDAAHEQPEADDEMDWLSSEPADEDWLGAFAKPESEVAAVPEPAESSPAPEAEQPEGWLSEMPEADVEPVQEAGAEDAVGLDTLEDSLFGPEDEAVETTESPVADEDEQAVAEPAPVSPEQDDAADATPAWMSDMEPIETPPPPEDEADALLQEPYDPFEGGSPDQVPEYHSAKETGVLQPDESPDWMTAFTGEEMPPDESDVVAEPEEAASLDELDFGPAQTVPIEPEDDPEEDAVTDSLADMSFEDVESDEYPGEEGDVGLDELASAEDEDGEMPDWLVAITSSEADKLGDMEWEEEETYSSAEESGVLQPSSHPDWLDGVGEVSDDGDGGEQAEGAETDPSGVALDALFDDFSLEDDAPAEMDLGDMAEDEDEPVAADEDEPESASDFFDDLVARAAETAQQDLEEAAFDEEFAEEPAADALETPMSDVFEDEFLVEEDDDLFGSAPAESEVAQPGDLAHTREIEPDLGDEPDDEFDDELDDEDLDPEDFAFRDKLPAWLRQPKESDTAAQSPADQEQAPEPPEWLREVPEDEDQD